MSIAEFYKVVFHEEEGYIIMDNRTNKPKSGFVYQTRELAQRDCSIYNFELAKASQIEVIDEAHMPSINSQVLKAIAIKPGEIKYEVQKTKDDEYKLVSIVATNFGGNAVNWITEGTLEHCERVKYRLENNVRSA